MMVRTKNMNSWQWNSLPASLFPMYSASPTCPTEVCKSCSEMPSPLGSSYFPPVLFSPAVRMSSSFSSALTPADPDPKRTGRVGKTHCGRQAMSATCVAHMLHHCYLPSTRVTSACMAWNRLGSFVDVSQVGCQYVHDMSIRGVAFHGPPAITHDGFSATSKDMSTSRRREASGTPTKSSVLRHKGGHEARHRVPPPPASSARQHLHHWAIECSKTIE